MEEASCVSIPQSGEDSRKIKKGGEKMLTPIRYLMDQRGVETLEWILIGGLITGVGIFLYPGVLQPALSTVITTITGVIATAT